MTFSAKCVVIRKLVSLNKIFNILLYYHSCVHILFSVCVLSQSLFLCVVLSFLFDIVLVILVDLKYYNLPGQPD